jgi:hypothetical protein
MTDLDNVSARRIAKILQRQIKDALSFSIFQRPDAKTMHADTVDAIKHIMNNAPVNDYSIASPVLAKSKGIDKDFIITKRGHHRPRYGVYLHLSDGSQVVLKTSRSLRKIKEYYHNLDISMFMWCDISFKPTKPVDYITIKLKVEQNA